MPLRILTYNVHGHKGTDGKILPERIFQVLRHADADIIGLQEFVNHRVGADARLLDQWAENLGMHGIYATSFHRGGEHFGNALLSRFAIASSELRNLSVPGHRQRIMLDCLLDWHACQVQVMVVHLGVSPLERRRQMASIIEALYETRADLHLLIGDFNEWHERSAFSRRLKDYFGTHRRMATFPSVRPTLGLDRIWVYPQTTSLTASVIRTADSRIASDHLPLMANIKPGSE
jgi:endonuclease/exonuclease/phosphatase family metal-dependent hydrolase